VRVVLCDPSAFTPQYDHELAAGLARAGADVELLTSRFRFGAAPAPSGYERLELFYPWSSRAFRRSPLRLPLKAVEHPLGMRRLARRAADVVHLQWLVWPRLDRIVLRLPAPAVFTAHDLLPRRSASDRGLWLDLFGRFQRVVVHSERGRELLTELGVPAGRLYVDRWPGETRIVDIALLPECRGRGVGRELIERIQAEGRDVTIHVERFNPAQRLYARLGFVPEEAGPVYLLMRWTPPR